MARITYRNLELQPNTGRWYFELVRGWDEPPEIRGEDTIIPSAAGRYPRTRIKDRLVLELRGWVAGQGDTDDLARQDYAVSMATLLAVFDGTLDPGALVVHAPVLGVPDGQIRTMNARYLSTLSSEVFGAGLFRSTSIELECVDFGGFTADDTSTTETVPLGTLVIDNSGAFVTANTSDQVEV